VNKLQKQLPEQKILAENLRRMLHTSHFRLAGL
jgi:hypothetical protein